VRDAFIENFAERGELGGAVCVLVDGEVVAYSAFTAPGGPLGLRPETIDALVAPAHPARQGFHDVCFQGPAKFSLGFMKPNDSVRFGTEAAFGAPGTGGSLGFADPSLRLAYGYVTDQMRMDLSGDPRDLALRRALDRVLSRG